MVYNKRVKRAYGHEPILLSTSPVKAAESSGRPQRFPAAKRLKRRLLVVCMGVVFIFVASAGLWILMRRDNGAVATPFHELSQSVRRTATFPVHYPKTLPEGWRLGSDSISVAAQLVTFTIDDGKGGRLVATQQALPPQEQLDRFYQEQVVAPGASVTPVGKAVIGSFEGRPLGAITAEKTWIVIRALSDIDENTFREILYSFRSVSAN